MGVGIGTTSTTPKPIFDGASRGRSQAKLQDGCRLARHWSGCRPRFGPGIAPRPRVCSDSTSVFTAAPLLLFHRRLDGDMRTQHGRVAEKTELESEQTRGRGA